MESDRSPSRITVTHRNGGNAFTEYSTLTVRDYFAAKAIPELIHYCSENRSENNWHEVASQMAYKVADAMLREREKQS